MRKRKLKSSKEKVDRKFRQMNYSVGDFLIRIKNAKMARLRTVELRSTKPTIAIAKVLKNQGYLDKVSEKDGKLTVRLTYRKKEPLILDVKLVSRPGLRTYKKVSELEKIKKPSMLILSTPKGVMTAGDAIKKRVGGEVIAEIL